MTNNSRGWAMQLVGEKIDLDDLQELLKKPFDPWVEDYETDEGLWALLRSNSWDRLTEATDVYQDAGRVIGLLNGQLRLIYTDAEPIKLGQTLKFGADGKRLPIIFAVTGQLRVTLGRVRGRVRAGTSASPKPPEESRIQRWLREAEDDDVRAELFLHISRADNWFDIYKSMELAQRVRGKENIVAVLGSDDWNKWVKVWRTANCHRHAPNPEKYPFPSDPPDLKQSVEFVLMAVGRLL